MQGDIDSVNHVGVAVRDLESASARFEALGFVLTPLSVHAGASRPGEPVVPMATGNRCIMFPHNYVEVLGIVNPGSLDWGCGDFLKRFQGGHIICFGCKDAAVVDSRVNQSGFKTSGVIPLQRDVKTPEGMRTARFDCVHFDRAAMPEGLIQAARHRNPEYIHQPPYLKHGNGATELADVVLVTSDPEGLARKYERLTGQTMRRDGAGIRIDLPLVSHLTFLSPDQIGAVLPGSLFSPTPSIAAMGFKVADLKHAEAVLGRTQIPHHRAGDRLIVPAEEALGVAVYFTGR
jgi:hypothetical protein